MRSLLVFLLPAGCKRATVEKPEAPDMSAIVQAYEAPSATFDDATARELERWLLDNLQIVNELGIEQAAIDAARKAVEEGHRAETTRKPRPDPANGKLDLTAGFTDNGIDPVVWGRSSACKYLGATTKKALVNGEVQLDAYFVF